MQQSTIHAKNKKIFYYTQFIFIVFIVAFVFTNLALSKPDKEIPFGNYKSDENYITIDGAKQYYEIYGQGEPLVLIHRNADDIAFMLPQIEYLSRNYKLIVMDYQGSGKSESVMTFLNEQK